MVRYNWCQGPVPGRGPAVEKHWSIQQAWTQWRAKFLSLPGIDPPARLFYSQSLQLTISLSYLCCAVCGTRHQPNRLKNPTNIRGVAKKIKVYISQQIWHRCLCTRWNQGIQTPHSISAKSKMTYTLRGWSCDSTLHTVAGADNTQQCPQNMTYTLRG